MRNLLSNSYLFALGVTLLSYALIYGFKRLFTIRIARLVRNTRNTWDDVVVATLERTTHFFMFSLALYIGYHFTGERKRWENLYADRFFFMALMIQIGIWANFVVDKWISSSINRKTKRNPAAASSISLIQLVCKLTLISIIFLFTLNNLGIKITTILAGLGVGGIAIALAVQKILGDLFSSLSIVLDKPFMVGDFIILDQYLGEVEKIGLKTTRIRSLGGEQIIISNSDLLSTRIRNYKRMHERRIAFVLNLVHGLRSDEIKKVVGLITAIISRKEKLRFERCHLMEIGLTSLKFETVYWVLSDDYLLHMSLQQEILLEIYQSFEEESLRFANPTQTLNIHPVEIKMQQGLSETMDQEKKQPSLS